MIGVLVNCGAIVFGSIIGFLFSKKFTEELSDLIMTGCGIVTIIIGIQMALTYKNIVFMALSLIIGAIIGFVIDIDGFVLKIGYKLEKLTKKTSQKTEIVDSLEQKSSKKNFPYAFLNSSVLFCTGAMAIVGSFEAGANHNYTTLFTKSILDGFLSIGYASTMGVGTAFSAISIFVYEGILSLIAVLIKPYVSDLLIQEVSAVGGAMIVMIGLNILGLKKIKTANFLPGLLVEILFIIFIPMIQNFFTK